MLTIYPFTLPVAAMIGLAIAYRIGLFRRPVPKPQPVIPPVDRATLDYMKACKIQLPAAFMAELESRLKAVD